MTQLSERVDRLERRLVDVEDAAAVALGPDRLDRLAADLDELRAEAATTEELVEVHLHSAKVAVELRRVTSELRLGLRALSDIDADEGAPAADDLATTA